LDLLSRRHWIFDLDGTLTVSVHDFAAFRAELGIPAGHGLLEFTAAQPPEQAARIAARITAWEAEHAELGAAEPDAVALLAHLASRGTRRGVLTRNTHANALRTLDVARLSAWFRSDDVVGRDDAAAKPSPDGVLRLLQAWNAAPDDAVMVGDWGFDIEAGRGAGVATVLVDRDGSAAKFADRADVTVRTLAELWSG
jgi:HAD superfamily hydrolase (TIGR01509 family)